ncbi:MAG: TetR/AcrR family transcriptional regulator [Phenylobacterium sp.]|uniref:TetR/AcrR family transcriptional regulator n=1 Tax=Phenylobacterium sp. TaxID=1871053 RepID=UPI0027361C7A|nr:TetR/AcrR family transcriptional regulator [Phenylobacterium sp.]MDP3748604.1 TetR/AcrR family transcriptional regulator [Phenylobacterium sp.]
MRYEKGRKDESRRRITEIAAERFRRDGIAASGLAGIMGEAGLTNGAFYPHFRSKADLVRESLGAALEDQTNLMREALAAGGLEAVLAIYLSAEHRDNPGTGCASAALLPEVARQPAETRDLFAQQLEGLIGELADSFPPQTRDPQGVALGVYATLVGALQLARAVPSKALSDQILSAGAEAARTLARTASDAHSGQPA